MQTFNKLVRDNIPKIIEDNNEQVKYYILDDEDYKKELRKKLVEESNEVLNSKTHDELLEELADIYEVFKQITKIEKINIEEIEKKANNKKMKKGGFDSKIFLEYSK